MHAARSGNVLGAEVLLALGAELHATSWRNGYSALGWAVRHGAKLVVKLLLKEERRRRRAAHAFLALDSNDASGGGGGGSSLVGSSLNLMVGVMGVGSNWLDGSSSLDDTGNDVSDHRNNDNDDDDDAGGGGSDLLVRPNGSTAYYPHAPLVATPDARGDLPVHLLARSYVATSRERGRPKDAVLERYTAVLAMLLDAMSLGADGNYHGNHHQQEQEQQEQLGANDGSNVGDGDGGESAGAAGGARALFRRAVVSVDAAGYDDRSALLILSRAEPEATNFDLIMSTFDLLLGKDGGAGNNNNNNNKSSSRWQRANVHATTPGGHTAVHLAADVGNHALVRRLVAGRGADPNVQSADGYTAYGYVRRKLRSSNDDAQQAAMRLLTKTGEVLLELGAYRLERSERAIDQGE